MTGLCIFADHRIVGSKDFNELFAHILSMEYTKIFVYSGTIFPGSVFYRLAYDVGILKMISRCIFLKQA
jgi:hypothetical protein